MNLNDNKKHKVINPILLTFILIMLTLSSNGQSHRNDYTGIIVYDKYFLVDKDSVYKSSGYLPNFITHVKPLLSYFSKDTLEFSICSGFDNDLIEIFYNDKCIYNKSVSTDNIVGVSDGFKYPIDYSITERKISVRMNRGKIVEILLYNNCNIILIDYLFEINELQITNTNVIPVFG